MTQPMRPSSDSLLAHEPFVRAVVRDLLRDESHVQDVLQETWIRALHQGPSKGGSLKGWLARVARRLAIDQHRGSARRDRREREAARGEALESVDALHARLEAQREVVDAVLALEEPYKSVVLLAYYEQLAPQAIGERLGRSAATVRSQLSRAHEILKRRLDQQHGGDRSAWAGVLLPWAIATKSKAGVLVAAGLGVGLLGVGAWVWPRMMSGRATAPASLTIELPASEPVAPSELAATVPSAKRESMSAISAAQQAAATQKPDLAKLGPDELRDLAVQAMLRLEELVFTPDPRFVQEQQTLLALPDTGVTRIYSRRQGGRTVHEGEIFARGGGAYFSFATLKHDYDYEPDLGFEVGNLQSGFYGLMTGMVFPIGDQNLTTLTPRASSPPGDLDPERVPGWEMLFTLPPNYDEAGVRPLQSQVSAMRLGSSPARVGMTYLVRTLSPNEHDHLVGVRVLEERDGYITIAWRVLLRFPAPGEHRGGVRGHKIPEVPPAPAWLQELEVPKLAELIHEVRRLAAPSLIQVPPELQQRESWRLAGASRSGWFRLVSEPYSPLAEGDGGGSYYSIENEAYMLNPWEVGLYEGTLQGRFLLDLGALDQAQYAAVVRGGAPAGLEAPQTEAFEFLWSVRSVFLAPDGVSNRALRPADEQRINSLLRGFPLAIAGHSCLLRTITWEGTDRLDLLSAIETSDKGSTLCWRELKRFDR